MTIFFRKHVTHQFFAKPARCVMQRFDDLIHWRDCASVAYRSLLSASVIGEGEPWSLGDRGGFHFW
jgi:hypothetical protein